MSSEHKNIEHESFSTQHVPTAALASALGGHLVSTNAHPITGRLEWTFRGVPADLLERVISDTVTVSARRMLSALEEMHSLLLQHRRRR
jgi:hypothetical protein